MEVKKMNVLKRAIIAAACTAGIAVAAAPALAETTLRVVMHSDLKILDPIWTTAYIVRNHGYMIYDTLFALDAKLQPQPEMVDSWTVSDDGLLWTFKLRDGLKWQDGPPVTTADVLPSIKRWTDKDTLGGLLAKSTTEMKAVDDRTFQIVLKEPFGLMLKALAKPASVPLLTGMMAVAPYCGPRSSRGMFGLPGSGRRERETVAGRPEHEL
jgi:peptide/nickel transport system substrate-binding protein